MAYTIDARQCARCDSQTAKVPRYWINSVFLPKVWYCSTECYEVDLYPGGLLDKLWRLTTKK